MAIYNYICSCGHTLEVNSLMKDYKEFISCPECKKMMRRDFKTDFGRQHHGDIWPMASYAAGVHHKQVPEMRKFDAEHEVPTEYTDDGDPVFRGPKHRRKYCEAHGLFDRNAGHSDPVPARCR